MRGSYYFHYIIFLEKIWNHTWLLQSCLDCRKDANVAAVVVELFSSYFLLHLIIVIDDVVWIFKVIVCWLFRIWKVDFIHKVGNNDGCNERSQLMFHFLENTRTHSKRFMLFLGFVMAIRIFVLSHNVCGISGNTIFP